MKNYTSNIPPDFFEEEIRDNYTITTEKKKIWSVELDLVNKLLEVCKKYDIKIFGFAGTLLGAVRHQGFIPWDDDMDVCILPEDFKKLESIADKEFEHPYFFQTALTDRKYFFGYARLRNSDTTGIISWNFSSEYNNGIFIDIFILNGITQNKNQLKKQLRKRDIIHKCLNTYYLGHEKKGIKKYILVFLSFLLKAFISYEVLVQLYRKELSKYDSSSPQVGLLTHNWDFIHKYWCEKGDLQEQIMVSYENIQIPISKNYDVILTHMYGDYMTFPPIESRGNWHEDWLIYNPDISYLDYFKNNKTYKK